MERDPTIHTLRYLLRRSAILDMLRHYEPGRFLEIGCGRGELIPWLARLGFRGVGVEISDEVRPLAVSAAESHRDTVSIIGDLTGLPRGQLFDFVFAFEVLEHIEDDADALGEWLQWLRPGGVFVASVPAHMKYWSLSDEAVGHFRRYERDDLALLLRESGLTPERWWSYGYPMVLLTRRLRHWQHRFRASTFADRTPTERTLESALDSTLTPVRGKKVVKLVSEAAGRLGAVAQQPFRETDLGDGYVVACRKAPR